MIVEQNVLRLETQKLMILYLFGCNHFSPLCRPAVEAWLRYLYEMKGEPPAFAAVEWSELNFD